MLRLSIGQEPAERGGAGRRALRGVRPDGRVTAVRRPEERIHDSRGRGGRRQYPEEGSRRPFSGLSVSSFWGLPPRRPSLSVLP